MNRGHGYLERFHCMDFDGQAHELDTVMFFAHTPSVGAWNLGIADSFRENITRYHGDFDDDGDLVFETIIRRGGGAPDLVKEAHEFDFLLGEWSAAHELTFPNGQVAKFPVNGTAVRALNGKAIMEHAWYDVDPQVPDAATTIIRIYNRAMRRWESMYTTNRFNGILHFGGVREEDEILLHSFEADLAAGSLAYWTFHSMGRDSYGWYANTSADRGATWNKTWIIEPKRKK